jgi:uncharacterized protein with PIN domain
VEPATRIISIRFYGELNDHLPRELRGRTLEKPFFVPGQVMDAIESFGVPHTEVELIVVGGLSVPSSYVVRDGDRIAVYPVFEAFDITPELRIRREALREPKFVLDVHLGRLAAYLRMLGFDAVYSNSSGDAELSRISSVERRVLLTRDRGLLKRSAATHGYLVRQDGSRQLLAEIIERFDLARAVRPFTRCMKCNSPLADVPKEEVQALLPPRVACSCEEFRRCPHCQKVYWKGSHYRRMAEWVRELTEGSGVVERPVTK